ncbi:MAG: bifunctional 5,10-methylenetetrahydrofolate dehydrogenase/5,10-methenyltetrahydrofolate cyclohydrolase [Candidatus Omnitrophica bacterium]|nr:bifunctional 5,10-methylenetetrahydrofolate dehydrogenase/5,10-methenyltetrahydrofolate cyclohydrolase [Candidatus Omnitrophota bacterium]
MAIILDAKEICKRIAEENKIHLDFIDYKLSLASVGLSNDQSANIYCLSQQKVAKELGLEYTPINLSSGISFKKFKIRIEDLNKAEKVTGIILNKPFPKQWKIKEEDIFSLIDYKKDVEGMHPINRGKFFRVDNELLSLLMSFSSSEIFFVSPTVLSIIELIKESFKKINDTAGYHGKRVTIVGFSLNVGKMLSLFLGNELATVSITHIATYEKGDLPFYVKNADILISAVGKPLLIKGSWIKKGAIVIDVGTAVKNNKITGDVEFDTARKKAAVITPVPGGVGRLTTLFLYRNLILAHKIKFK